MKPKLRPIKASDRPFEIELFSETRKYIFDRIPLPPDQKLAMIKSQVELQRASYAAQHPNARVMIIELNGEPVGRYIYDSTPTEVFIIDVAILPKYQKQGIGSNVMAPQLEEVRRGKSAYLHVAKENIVAQKLYERIGFTLCGQTATHFRMVLTPETIK